MRLQFNIKSAIIVKKKILIYFNIYFIIFPYFIFFFFCFFFRLFYIHIYIYGVLLLHDTIYIFIYFVITTQNNVIFNIYESPQEYKMYFTVTIVTN